MNDGPSLWRDPETCDGLFPAPEPQPIGACTDCLVFSRSRHAARSTGDHSLASDMDALMRRRQAPGAGAALMAARSRKRFRDYTVKTGPGWPSVFSARCASGTDDECSESSGALNDYDALVRWASQHCADTDGQHRTFRRSVADGLFVEPGAWH